MNGSIPLRALLVLALFLHCAAPVGHGTTLAQSAPRARRDAFRQLEETLPTPGGARAASGAPGSRYWQQRADYRIEVGLDEARHHVTGRESITYHNRSPHELRYLWLQLDNNILRPDSDAELTRTAPDFDRFGFGSLRRLLAFENFDGGVEVSAVTDAKGTLLPHAVVGTMMRVDLPSPLGAGEDVTFAVHWNYAINDARVIWARTGYEYFPDDGNTIYEIAHWYPRMAAYTDVNGWQHKQFIGSGEFTLDLGNFEVAITVPADHVVAATGVLQNPHEVLSEVQRQRLDQARVSSAPVFVVTPEEARAAESVRGEGTRTWVYRADDVRDFAFATSRKFIWDAQGVAIQGKPVLAMSFYPKEGEPLWSKYSTHAIIHTLEVYSRYTFGYPYPTAISVNGPIGGMEYPMICFNGPRPEEDGTYSKRTKYGLISVIIHEVGHNYFPMIVNSDERQWTWMDEGLNTFLQYLAEQEWEDGYPSRRGEPQDIVEYMKSERQVPIMTNSESLLQFGNNAYAKPATALNILRETILGRELFDFAFREYARRWQFKRPMPADLFRTLEDASGIDLDWFWRGWFYGTNHVDIGITSVERYVLDTLDPDIDRARDREQRERHPETISMRRNRRLPKRVATHPELLDFYNEYDELDVTEADREKFRELVDELEPKERELLATRRNFTVVEFENIGGLVMPIILRLELADGTDREVRIPAEIWRRDDRRVRKLFVTKSEIRSIELDPYLETADTDLSNNSYPARPQESRFRLFRRRERERNPIQRARQELQRQGGDAKSEDGEPAAGPVGIHAEDGAGQSPALPQPASTGSRAAKPHRPGGARTDK